MLNLFDVVACSPKIKAVVNMASRLGKSITFLQELKRSRLRHDVWHIENRCHTASGSSPRLALHRSLMRKTRVTHVDMLIDDSWQQKTVGTIDQLIAIMNGGDAAQAVVGEGDSGTNDTPAEAEPSQTEETEA